MFHIKQEKKRRELWSDLKKYMVYIWSWRSQRTLVDWGDGKTDGAQVGSDVWQHLNHDQVYNSVYCFSSLVSKKRKIQELKSILLIVYCWFWYVLFCFYFQRGSNFEKIYINTGRLIYCRDLRFTNLDVTSDNFLFCLFLFFWSPSWAPPTTPMLPSQVLVLNLFLIHDLN